MSTVLSLRACNLSGSKAPMGLFKSLKVKGEVKSRLELW